MAELRPGVTTITTTSVTNTNILTYSFDWEAGSPEDVMVFLADRPLVVAPQQLDVELSVSGIGGTIRFLEVTETTLTPIVPVMGETIEIFRNTIIRDVTTSGTGYATQSVVAALGGRLRRILEEVLGRNRVVDAVTSVAWAAISGIPQFASRWPAWEEVTGKPTIPDAQVPSDWNATTGVARILNKPTSLGGPSGNSVFDITELYNANYDITSSFTQVPNFTLPTTGAGRDWLLFNFGVIETGEDGGDWFWVKTGDIGNGAINSVILNVFSSGGAQGRVFIYRNAAGNLFMRSTRGNEQNAMPLRIYGVVTSPLALSVRGPMRAKTRVLPTAAVGAKNVNTGDNAHRIWDNTVANGGWLAPDGGVQNFIDPYGRGGGGTNNQLILPPVAPNLQTNGWWFVSKVGTEERHSVFIPWGPGVTTEEGNFDFTDAILYFRGGNITPSAPNVFSSILIAIRNVGGGYIDCILFGQGDELPANCTVECFESGVFIT